MYVILINNIENVYADACENVSLRNPFARCCRLIVYDYAMYEFAVKVKPVFFFQVILQLLFQQAVIHKIKLYSYRHWQQMLLIEHVGH